ncbi:bifunctional 4-hydroxy-2-oxoglutarate aldolase/2-dehydro-3-deoxy-phosphogluconate aldolase [Aurantibacter crassamenti]|uniref:bifunctional 4-hydroxy-2-oxoglutarate aldolase/2-dehydro-3-deoxy-phosphogluconate aldolase n=1 Tax=Aurantibacter crassamenti TaxID=1837375 RepID=UPI001939B7D0|nr:bifunctional 4-hydroxy-2-oxoglutarate aldolase/2-dehydro-3-deoxy-phosphogluconate aldolase [Aurantibacter crassamenti]MBM1107704.1 bifunctional 4-hydroxy-2-oxoglutarate aldolase/2-dehydro-3-deoxy-phosphogluconate aldolase [Aurantibacter crassamenti]
MKKFEPKAMSPEIAKKIDDAGIIAVLVIDEVKHAIPLANALLEGGIDTIELTLRTPVAIEAAKIIRKEVPEITLGFGTVLNVDQVKQVVDVGADFAVSPGCNPKIISEAIKHGLSFAPGIMTPTDIEIAVQEGCRILKFFPAESSGGMKHLESMSAPYNYLDLKFIPLGGCNINNASTYLQSNLITAIGGSWVANRSLIQTEDWGTITNNAKEIKSLITSLRF